MFEYGGKKWRQVRWGTGQSVVLIRGHDDSNHLRKNDLHLPRPG